LISEKGSFSPTRVCVKNALGISLPMAVQNLVMRGAYIVTTIIIAPLGTVAIAANMFGIMAESFCYMPGSGISDAATSLVGQSLGAGRKELAKGFAKITMGTGMTSHDYTVNDNVHHSTSIDGNNEPGSSGHCSRCKSAQD
jgi:Na+-driven multidrug efflux pump